MRNLFMLVGAPASGKSTLVRNLGLENYTVEADGIREIVSNPTSQLIEDNPYKVKKVINYQDEAFTWKVIYDILERRMSQGETIIMDSTHLYKGAFGKELELAKKYNYHVTAIDMMEDVAKQADKSITDIDGIVDKLMEYDHSRGDKIDNRDVLERYTKRYEELRDRKFNNIQVIKPKEFYNLISDGVVDMNKYTESPYQDMNRFNRIKVIGDVHGDLSSLKKVFSDHERGDAYIFVGDYLDRGTKNAETFKFLMTLKANNIFFIRGNHELNAEKFVTEGRSKGQFGHKTLAELMKAGITKKDLASFQSRLVDVIKFEFGGKLYIVTHAGVEAQRVNTINIMTDESELVMGLSSKEHSPYDIDVDKRYASPYKYNSDKTKKDVLPTLLPTNIHGHRNAFNTPVITKDISYSINLTDDNDFRFIIIKPNGELSYYSEERIDSPTLVERMIEDDGVRQKQVEGTDIIAHNFTKEVFFSAGGKRWTPQSLQARGFFTRGEDIIGRGFTKFFNIGETPDSTLDSLVYPVKVFKKWNGFLGIAFYDTEAKKLRIVTKSGGTSIPNVDEDNLPIEIAKNTPYSEDTNGSLYDALYGYLKTHDHCSVALEIISTKDPHIIKYTKNFAKPLAVIDNYTGKFVPTGEYMFNINPLKVVNNKEELDDFLKNNSGGYDNEGFVLRGKNKQLKLKTPYYLKAKELRGRLDLYKEKGAKKFYESGYGKDSKWYYGAQDWFNRATSRDILDFSPELAIELYKEDESNL